ncbi:DNA polymerase V [Pontibacter aydingkolensis]|uniref:Translesion error-prone DNA polymerase V autoproteolytic subunit n=1 Tax=Pontibacter aydingkolensis TaxID=1911536 RepID=A0ABS7CWA7_9BACT|nr:translesion error-prone DNA polymerase V autoproteolytic subunit [Pontibacter aydingkolensis]MBW7467986.1 translesion error-prone DNA polymerase V autoproteolytic subunit [Pontibacter aydingkolensis]
MILETVMRNANGTVFGKAYYPDLQDDIELALFGNSVACGFPSPSADYIEETINLNKHLIRNPSSTYFIKASGESMREACIRDTDLLIVDKSIKVKNGYPIVCWLNGGFTIKTYRKEKDKIYLEPANPNYQKVELAEGMDFTFWGVVSYSIHNCLTSML